MFEITPFSEEHFCGEYLKGAVAGTVSNTLYILTAGDLLLNITDCENARIDSGGRKVRLTFNGEQYPRAIPQVTNYGTNLVTKKLDPRLPALSGYPVLKVKVDPWMHVLRGPLIYKANPSVEYKTLTFQGERYTFTELSATQVGMHQLRQAQEDFQRGAHELYWIEAANGRIDSHITSAHARILCDDIQDLLDSLGL